MNLLSNKITNSFFINIFKFLVVAYPITALIYGVIFIIDLISFNNVNCVKSSLIIIMICILVSLISIILLTIYYFIIKKKQEILATAIVNLFLLFTSIYSINLSFYPTQNYIKCLKICPTKLDIYIKIISINLLVLCVLITMNILRNLYKKFIIKYNDYENEVYKTIVN